MSKKREEGQDHNIKRKQANWISHVLRRNCVVKHVVEGKIFGRGGRGRSKLLLDDLKEKRRYWKCKEKPLDRTLWKKPFGEAMDM
jgi:hypothetical protein